jgi:DNA adenine methylase
MSSSLATPSRVAQPFIKWAGGKSQLLGELEKYFPKEYDRYFEPFLGGGAVFFHLKPEKAILSDANFELINTYRVVANKTDELIAELQRYELKPFSEELYYEIRDMDYESLSNVERAARFIFLNKTCYNGLYRVNKEGKFNVPFGKYDRMPRLFEAANLKGASSLLRKATIRAEYYLPVLKEFHATRGDFVYLDPPYSSEGSNGFTSYTKDTFNWSEQQKLAKEFVALAESGCKVILSNANEKPIRDLYVESAKAMIPVKADRMINSNGKQRTGYSELIILSYVPELQTLKAWVQPG